MPLKKQKAQRLSEEFNYDHEKIARFMSKSRSFLRRCVTLRLLSLPKDVIALIEEGNLQLVRQDP